MFDKDWWNGNFEENTLTYAEYGHRTESGCLYVWLLGGEYVPLTVEPVGEESQDLRAGEGFALDLRLFLLNGSVFPEGEKGVLTAALTKEGNIRFHKNSGKRAKRSLRKYPVR